MPTQSPLQIFLRFLRFGSLAWGGPVAQIAMLKQELVEEEQWVSQEHFNRALAVYQALPGPEAHKLCVWFGMRAGGRWGGFLAGLGFMLPGLLLMLLGTWLYVRFGLQSPLVKAMFGTIQAGVIALIFFAVYRIGKHALVNKKLLLLAIGSVLFMIPGLHVLLVLAGSGLIYLFWEKGNWPMALLVVAALLGTVVYLIYAEGGFNAWLIANTARMGPPTPPPPTSLATVFLTGLKGGLLTFGGAYTAIPFVWQDVLEYRWMTHHQFMDGLAIAGILPAPLVIFSTFVGYFGGGWPGALLITLGMFLPAFSFTLIGHTLMERLIANPALHRFLDGVTAGVIGLIGMTALTLFLDTIYEWFPLVVFGLALAVLICYRSKYAGIFIIAGAALAGAVGYFV